MNDVFVIMGSVNDWEVMKEACSILEDLHITYQKEVVSAHRTPEKMVDFAKNAKRNGVKVIIAGAGGAAHLPGMVASLSTLPVIGVPIQTKSMQGLDSLLSIVQMPFGIPVATMAINNSKNAALFAAAILALQDEKLARRLEEFRTNQTKETLEKALPIK